ncbi:T9SS type A sorting domain-containing protein, partial [bacterium]|nr:T9SS type A sorting domain-containing protein [bacterium]
DAVADLTLTGAAANDYFGIAVAGAGDVNGDGFDDVLVSGYGNDSGGSNAGQAYVFFGGLAADAVADLVFTGEAANDYFGVSVGGAGDVNGDGFDDVIVGAYANDAGGSAAGRAYVFHCGPAGDDVADLIFTGAASLDGLGTSVASAGDVNGDGYDDVIVGANGSDAGGGNAGRAYVYLGGPAADGVADVVLTGEAAGDNLGRSVAGAGDVNGDGFADVIVGAYSSDAGGVNAGRAYVYHGGPAPDAVADRTLTGTVAGEQFGFSVAGAGDGNGDGLGDVLVGANLGAGSAFVYECGRYFVTSPAGGDTWNVGATAHVRWLGAEPADVSLSVDGGSDFVTLATSVGGDETNAFPLVVPHLPTRFARVRVTPSNSAVTGSGVSDSLFTIDASIALLSFRASFRDGAAVVTWQTDPAPEDLAAYRLERATGGAWRTLIETLDTEYIDEDASGGATYRLTAINGLGTGYLLGETTLGLLSPLAAWPTPYRGGELQVSFATLGGLGGSAGPAEVVLYDVTGRAVRTIVRGEFEAGTHETVWDGLDGNGRAVSSGVYFLQVRAAGNVRAQKLVVIR